MPYPQKHSNEKKDQVRSLWKLGREGYKEGEKQHGRYTLKDIEKLTGIPHKVCWMIAKGLR